MKPVPLSTLPAPYQRARRRRWALAAAVVLVTAGLALFLVAALYLAR